MNLHFEREPAFSTALWLSESSKFNRHIFFFAGWLGPYLQRIGTTHLKVALFSEVSEISEAPNTHQWASFLQRKCGERHRRWSAFEAHSKATLLTHSIVNCQSSYPCFHGQRWVLITALIGWKIYSTCSVRIGLGWSFFKKYVLFDLRMYWRLADLRNATSDPRVKFEWT